MNKYRVDRTATKHAPVGMNSIRYFGPSLSHARKVFDELDPGLDAWDQPDEKYGVLLTIHPDDTVLDWKPGDKK